MTYKPRLPPYAHQAEGLAKMRGQRAFSLTLQMRCGKSKILLDEWGEMVTAGEVSDLLIIARAGQYRNWTLDKPLMGGGIKESELRSQLDPALFERVQSATWISGSARAQREVEALLKAKGRPRVLNINVEALSGVKKAREAVLEFLSAKRAVAVVDECFPAGTLITTEKGQIPIEKLKERDIVCTSDGTTRIKKILRKQSCSIVVVRLSNGVTLRVTPNHPLFTDEGWVCAGNALGRTLYGANDLQKLWEKVPSRQGNSQILRAILRFEMEYEQTRDTSQDIHRTTVSKDKYFVKRQKIRCSFMEQRDPHEKGEQEKAQSNFEEDWAYIQNSWGEWAPPAKSAADAFRHIRPAMDTGARHSIRWQAAWLSNLLQGRLGEPQEKVGDRVRRSDPQQLCDTGLGSQKGPETGRIRVESVTIEESRNPIDVFDLELEGIPHFFAEGVLVHNSTSIRSHTADRTKFIWNLRKLAPYRRIMTGLVTPRSPLDLYGQFFFLDPQILGHYSYFTFRSRYAVLYDMPIGEYFRDPRSGEYKRRTAKVVARDKDGKEVYRHQDELAARIAPYSYRKLLSECYDVPETFYIMREIELTPEQKRLYTEIKENATALLAGGAYVTATEAMSQVLRLHQVLCGHVGDENGELHMVPNKRVDAVLEVLEDYDGKAIIWSHYVPLLKAIYERLEQEYGPGSAALFYGGNRGTRHEDEARFLGDPGCRFMCATQGAGGYGNTWSNADLAIYASNSFDLEHRDQSEWRTLQVGKARNVTNVDLVVPGTVDEKVLRALRNKINVAGAIMGDQYREWLI